MSDQEASTPNQRFRRKRRFQGASWTPSNMSAVKEDGVWCPAHKQRHGYKSVKLGITYDKRTNGNFVILWYCVETGNVLEEKELT